MKKIIIAIDGFSSCGKSTLAKQLAKKLNYVFVDSGAMYRAITLFAMKKGYIGAGFFDTVVIDAGHGGHDDGARTSKGKHEKVLALDISQRVSRILRASGLRLVETRTGDTPANRRARQRAAPPHILLTTPESLALLLSQPEAREFFAGLGGIIIDEIHALAGTKRGDQLALCLSRLAVLAPGAKRIGLSATVAAPDALRAWLAPDVRADSVRLITAEAGAAPVFDLQLPEGHLPWGGHMGLASMPEVYRRIEAARVAGDEATRDAALALAETNATRALQTFNALVDLARAEAGLSRETFMLRLEKEVEARSDALMREVGFDPDAKQN